MVEYTGCEPDEARFGFGLFGSDYAADLRDSDWVEEEERYPDLRNSDWDDNGNSIIAP